MTRNPYECHHDVEDATHATIDYVTDLFTDSSIDLDSDYYVVFGDSSGKKYASSFKLEHLCTVLQKDSVQQVSPPAKNNLPFE